MTPEYAAMHRSTPCWIGILSFLAAALAAAFAADARLHAQTTIWPSESQRALEQAETRLRHFVRDQYPLTIGQLERDAAQQRANIATLERQAVDLERLNEPYWPTRPFAAEQGATVRALQAARLGLENLEAQRLILVRQWPDLRREYELDVERARQQISQERQREQEEWRRQPRERIYYAK